MTRTLSQKVATVSFSHEEVENNFVLEDLPRLLPEMKFDKFEFEEGLF